MFWIFCWQRQGFRGKSQKNIDLTQHEVGVHGERSADVVSFGHCIAP